MTDTGPRPPLLWFDLLDGFRVLVDGRPLPLPSRKPLALLALLVASAPHRVSRALARGLLWPDSSEVDAQNSLRNVLWQLRNGLGGGGAGVLQATRTDLWLDPGECATDLDRLKAGLAAGLVDPALRAGIELEGRLMPLPDATDLLDQRLGLFRQRMLDEMAARAEGALPGAAVAQRIELLTLLVELRPLHEGHQRGLLTALIAAGRKAEALAAYQRLWNRLDTEFGEEPAAGTQAVIVALKQAEERVDPVPESRPVIVVEAGAATADAVQAVLAALARFREWRVVDARYLADRSQTIRAAGGRAFVLNLAQARGAGRGVTAVLADPLAGQVIWSEDLAAEGAMDRVSEAAVRRFATAMNLLLSGPNRPRGPADEAEPPGHYEIWLQAQAQMRAFTPEGWAEAERALDRILAENGRHVRALAARASIETMRQIAFPGTRLDPEGHRRALAWAAAATQADPIDSRAQLALAWACAMSREFDRAEVAFELAFQQNGNDPWTIASALIGFAFCDRPVRSARLLAHVNELGLVLEPFHWSYLAAAQFLLGDDAACIASSERAAEVSADVPAWHAAALALSGQADAARATAARFLERARAEWVGPARPGDAEITAWLLGCFPIRTRAHWLRLREGLARAGLPVPQT